MKKTYKPNKKYIKLCEMYGIDWQVLDWGTIFGEMKDLTKSEQEEYLIQKIIEAGGKLDINKEAEMLSKKQLKERAEEAEMILLRQEEKEAQEQINNAIEEALKRQDSQVRKFFKPLKEYIRIVANSEGNLNSLFIVGPGGLGKTTVVLTTLKELGKKFVYTGNYSTTVEFVNFLYEHKDDIVVFDDMEKLFDNPICIEILKGALWGFEGKRIVSYLTTSPKLRAPKQFEVTGKYFFCLNKKLDNKNPLLKALISRSLVYNLEFSYKELMVLLGEISKLPYRNLTKKEREMIFRYIKENTDETCPDLNIRTLIKAFDIYIENKKEWKELLKPLLRKDEKLFWLKKCIEESETIKQAQQKWSEITGLGRTQFYLYKRKIYGGRYEKETF